MCCYVTSAIDIGLNNLQINKCINSLRIEYWVTEH